MARDIAGRLAGNLIPMAAMLDKPQIFSEADNIGIIFPVHNVVNGGVPFVVRKFLAKLENVSSTYIFAVCTCGAGSGDALIKIGKLIQAKGGTLRAGYTIKMPFNCPPFTRPEERLQRFEEWNLRLDEICDAVVNRKEIKFATLNPLIRALVYPLGQIMHHSILKKYRRLAQDPTADFDDAVRLIDRSYYVDKNCDGCRICAQVCPAENIALVDSQPAWLHHCASCLSCLVWCPRKAIYGGILNGKSERYHHPQVKLQDMLPKN